MSLQLLIHFKVKEDKLDSFKDLMNKTKEELPKAPGCHGLTILNSEENPCHFVLIETWIAKDLHDAYFEQMEKSGIWKYITSHLEQEPTTEYFLDY